MKILIAEDEPDFRQLMKDILANWGYEVAVAQDGNEAWQALKSRDAPQIAVLDWMMPGINGVDICRKVRKELKEPYTYLILLTAQHRDQDLVSGMEAGADDYIIKPPNIDELRVRLRAGKRIVELHNDLVASRQAIADYAAGLETANRDLEAFTYTVSNDLLRSLMSIGDYAHAIRDFSCSKNDEQCHDYTTRIYKKIKDLGMLIGIMNDFFRPMRIDLHREVVDLSEMVSKITDKLKASQPDRRVTIRIPDRIAVDADRNLLQMALTNLLNNAWKCTGKHKEAVIEFGVKKDQEDLHPTYFVRDNGIGFDMENADKLFKPFQQLPGTEEFAGQGIGLATVERIIRRHGGKVWAEGEPNKGACFYFTLAAEEVAT